MRIVAVVWSLNCVQLFVTPWTVACQAPLFFTISQSLLQFMSIQSVMPSSHLILSPFAVSPSPPSPFAVSPSIRVFFSELAVGIR